MLALNSFLAILGVFVLRFREPDLPRPYKAWGYPFVPLIYLAITAFMLVFVVTCIKRIVSRSSTAIRNEKGWLALR